MRFLRLSIILTLFSFGILAGCTVPIPVTPVPVEVGVNEVIQSTPAPIAEVPPPAIIAPTTTPLPVAAAEPAVVDEASQPEEPVQTETTNVEGIPCVVPDVIGLDQAVAESLLMGIGLRPVRAVVIDETMAAGSVISQDPASGTIVDPCEGYVMVTISAAMPDPPTITPVPPTAMPTETLVPTTTATSTPVPASLSFFDNFETGISAEWSIIGQQPSIVNGRLVADSPFEAYVDRLDWTDYRLTIQGYVLGYGGYVDWSINEILIRFEDRDNYMILRCEAYYNACFWVKVVNGEQREIPQTRVGVSLLNNNVLRIEVEGDVYRFFVGSEQMLYFVDSTFSSGGIGLRHLNGKLEIEDIEVTPLLE